MGLNPSAVWFHELARVREEVQEPPRKGGNHTRKAASAPSTPIDRKGGLKKHPTVRVRRLSEPLITADEFAVKMRKNSAPLMAVEVEEDLVSNDIKHTTPTTTATTPTQCRYFTKGVFSLFEPCDDSETSNSKSPYCSPSTPLESPPTTHSSYSVTSSSSIQSSEVNNTMNDDPPPLLPRQTSTVTISDELQVITFSDDVHRSFLGGIKHKVSKLISRDSSKEKR
jgi:hypothetical protein